jgi:hypothetical protein
MSGAFDFDSASGVAFGWGSISATNVAEFYHCYYQSEANQNQRLLRLRQSRKTQRRRWQRK